MREPCEVRHEISLRDVGELNGFRSQMLYGEELRDVNRRNLIRSQLIGRPSRDRELEQGWFSIVT
jgi:hypothetical protein